MDTKTNNCAYIDGANLYKGVFDMGWKLDYRRFRVWLRDKYQIDQAYLFLGLVPRYKDLYTKLQEDGYTLIFKETIYDGDGKVKGNCDADLVLRVVCDVYENACSQTVIVTSDGDYASLIQFLLKKDKLNGILSPSDNCSILIKRTNAPITYLSQLKDRLSLNRKSPR